MDSEGVSIPLIHEHPMIPWNDLRRGDCCRAFEASSDGYYCKSCDHFVHKKCGDEVSESIQHPSHTEHTLRLREQRNIHCSLCGRYIVDLCYGCEMCYFYVDLHCAKYPPPEVIETCETHPHKLTLVKRNMIYLNCGANCGKKIDEEFPYKCHECNINFHLGCVWYQSEVKYLPEVNHSHHSLHPLKLLRRPPPNYSDGKCRLCGARVGRSFYHCSSCKFTVDLRCVLHPPPQFLVDLRAHAHQLTLLPRLDSFTCNACGLKGDRSPYICAQCNFMIHQDCLDLPRVININRHDHRIYRTCFLGVENSVCRICRQKVDWEYGGYSCHKCPSYVVHSKCATLKNVWNGKELEDVPEEEEDTEPYEVIDDKTIKHFSHQEHHLRLNNVLNGIIQWEEKKRCSACTQTIDLQSFYGCVDCDFFLHQNCAQLPKKKRHALHNERLTLVTNQVLLFCDACGRISNGFSYKEGLVEFDARCCSIYEPFLHPSHPHHPLYYIPHDEYGAETCNGCLHRRNKILRCIDNDCRFFLCFRCATLPQVVKHRVEARPLSLCYGEKEDASGKKYWCDICEKETDPKTWFYTCKDHRDSLHVECVLGDLPGLMPRSIIEYWYKSYEVVLNDSVSRPFCEDCESRCIPPIILKLLGTSDTYFCSFGCLLHFKFPNIKRCS